MRNTLTTWGICTDLISSGPFSLLCNFVDYLMGMFAGLPALLLRNVVSSSTYPYDWNHPNLGGTSPGTAGITAPIPQWYG